MLNTKSKSLIGFVLTIVFLLVFVLCLFACSKDDSITKGLDYNVKADLSYNADYNLKTFEDADNLENKIISHVDSTAEDMKNIFQKRYVSIAELGALAHVPFLNEPGKFKPSAKDQAAIDDLATWNTKIIYKAICDVSKQGGGTVVVPAVNNEVFYTCPIHLENNVNLYLDNGATLKFTQNTNLYLGDFMKEVYGDNVDDKGLTLTRYESVEVMNYSPFIYAYGKKNIAVSGKGTLDGSATQGDGITPGSGAWEDWHIKTTINGKQNALSFDNSRAKLFADAQNDVKLSKRQYGEGSGGPTSGSDDGWLRPNFIQPYNCQNFAIKDVKIINSPMWEVNPVMCDTVLMQNVNIDSHMPNNDGVDPESTSNMVIRNNTFNVGDDCIAVKSGRNADGLKLNKPTYNLVIVDNLMKDGHGGIAIGSEITAGVKNVFAHNNTMTSDVLDTPYRFKTNYIRGGFIENVFYKDDVVKSSNPKKAVVSADLNYDIKKEVADMVATGAQHKAYTPRFENVHMKNFRVNADKIAGKGGKSAFQLLGYSKDSIADSCDNKDEATDCYVSNITMEDSYFYGSMQAFEMKYVDGFNLSNVDINGTLVDDTIANCKNIDFKHCNFSNSKILRNKLEAIENSKITNCMFN